MGAAQALAVVTLESSFNVTQTYTDNLLFDDDDKISDFGTLFGPNLTLQYENPDIVLGVRYFGRMAIFYENPDESQYIQNANIILDLPFLTKRYQNLTVKVDETLNFTPQLDAFSFSTLPIASRDKPCPARGIIPSARKSTRIVLTTFAPCASVLLLARKKSDIELAGAAATASDPEAVRVRRGAGS